MPDLFSLGRGPAAPAPDSRRASVGASRRHSTASTRSGAAPISVVIDTGQGPATVTPTPTPGDSGRLPSSSTQDSRPSGIGVGVGAGVALAVGGGGPGPSPGSGRGRAASVERRGSVDRPHSVTPSEYAGFSAEGPSTTLGVSRAALVRVRRASVDAVVFAAGLASRAAESVLSVPGGSDARPPPPRGTPDGDGASSSTRALYVHARCNLHSLDMVSTSDQTWSGDVSLLFTVSIPVVKRLRTVRRPRPHDSTASVQDAGGLRSRHGASVSSDSYGDPHSHFGGPPHVAPQPPLPQHQQPQPHQKLGPPLSYGTSEEELRAFGSLRSVAAEHAASGLDEDGDSSQWETVSTWENSLFVHDNSLIITPPEDWKRKHGAQVINDSTKEGRAYMDELESNVLNVNVTNLMEATTDHKVERWVQPHTDFPPPGTKRARFAVGSATDCHSCFTLTRRYKATFRQVYSLRLFPLDTQWLVVEVSLGQGEDSLCFAPVADPRPDQGPEAGRIFEPDKGDMLVLEPGHCPALAEWNIYTRVTAQTHKTEREKSRSLIQYSRQRFLFRVRRKYSAYIENVAFTMLLITTLSGSAWFIDVATDGAVGNRLVVLVTLLLSAVSFRFIVRSYLPSIAYMTLLDHYVRSSMVFTFVSVCEVSLVTLVVSPDGSRATLVSVDNAAWAAIAASWVVFNLYCLLRVMRHAATLDESLIYTDHTYEDADAAAEAAALLLSPLDENDIDHNGDKEAALKAARSFSLSAARAGAMRSKSVARRLLASGMSSLGLLPRPTVAPWQPPQPPAPSAASGMSKSSRGDISEHDRQQARRYGWKILGMPVGLPARPSRHEVTAPLGASGAPAGGAAAGAPPAAPTSPTRESSDAATVGRERSPTGVSGLEDHERSFRLIRARSHAS